MSTQLSLHDVTKSYDHLADAQFARAGGGTGVGTPARSS